MVYRFDFYQSKNTGIPVEYKTLVLVESVVMRLVENLPQIENFILTFFFTVIPLVAELKNEGFCALGVLKINRRERVVLMLKSETKKGGKGTVDTHVSKDKNICIVRWQNKNMVNVVSNFVGIGEKLNAVKRTRKNLLRLIDLEQLDITIIAWEVLTYWIV